MLLCIEYILFFELIKYILYSFAQSFSTFDVGLLFTRLVAWVNLLSSKMGERMRVNVVLCCCCWFLLMLPFCYSFCFMHLVTGVQAPFELKQRPMNLADSAHW